MKFISILLISFAIKAVWTKDVQKAQRKVMGSSQFDNLADKAEEIADDLHVDRQEVGARDVARLAKELTKTNEYKNLVDKVIREINRT